MIIMSQKATVSTGGHLIDPHCNCQTGTLVEHNNMIYDCTLNQTDLKTNANKFYIMQVLKNGHNYIVFLRYGRIGESGRIDQKNFSSELDAIIFFEKQFKSKTGNAWCNKDKFEKKNGKYFLTEIETAEVSDVSDSESEIESDDNDMDERVIDFLKLISNMEYMKQSLTQLDIDVNKMPLGKISQKQIDAAYKILGKINKKIDGDIEVLIDLSSKFYTLIPYICNRAQKPPIISTKKLVGKNLNLLNELSQLAYGAKAVTKMKGNKSALAKLYTDLNTEIVPLDTTDEMYQILETYLKNSMAPTHHFRFEILNMYQLDRPDERAAYDVFSEKLKNKTLLFHGTRIPNLIGILKNGLVVDPSKLGINVSIAGKMFGMGLYFANSCTKSIQYTDYYSSGNIACLFVSEVALGKMLIKKGADSSLNADTLPKGYHSTWGMGSSGFDKYDKYDDGTQIPCGKLAQKKEKNLSLLYDEFIVYHEEQINLRYIIKLKIIENYNAKRIY